VYAFDFLTVCAKRTLPSFTNRSMALASGEDYKRSVQGKGHKVVKKKAPVQLTGGAGFHYENPVAARFLLDLLAGSNALGVDFGRIVRLDWQARDSEWLADDLVVTCKQSNRDRAAGISIKSAQQVTRAGFPLDFVEIAWAHARLYAGRGNNWLGVKTDRKLRDSNDAIVLVTGSLAQDVETHGRTYSLRL
jgi:hypothetical protein